MTQDLVLSGGNVIDVRTGDIKIASIHIRDGIIRAISSSLAQPSDATVLDVTGQWVIPGLIEIHTHTRDSISLRRALGLGVTATLTIYTGNEIIPPQWEYPSNLPGNPIPRMYLVGGRFRVGAERRQMRAPTTPEEVGNDLDFYKAEGVSRIKIWVDDGTVQHNMETATFDDRVLSAIVSGAYARGMKVYVHALTGKLYRRAIAAGPDWIIHPMVTDKLTTSDVDAIKNAGLGWSTVMSIVLWNGDPRRYARMALSDPRLVSGMSPEVLKRHQNEVKLTENPNQNSRPRIVERVEDYLDNVRANTRLAVESGLRIAVGSDKTAGYGTHLEIELLRDAGLDPVTILRAATLGGAEALGVSDKFGTVEMGKVADLVVLSSNPLNEITNLRDIMMVLKGGHIWTASELLSK